VVFELIAASDAKQWPWQRSARSAAFKQALVINNNSRSSLLKLETNDFSRFSIDSITPSV